MSWYKKSKYKQDYYNWWEEEEKYESKAVTTKNDYYGGYGWGGYNNYYYKPRYDMSISLETRVTQLIKTITGKELKLTQAGGWGNDDRFFYYNPEDLKDVSDDEVLGRILQQLGKEIYWDKVALNNEKQKQPAYRHLWDSLEANRADRQLAERYNGTTYYAGELWNSRKVKDNPLNNYEQIMPFEEWYKVEGKAQNWGNRVWPNSWDAPQQQQVKDMYRMYTDGIKGKQNDAWEFCFNIHAYQNGEKQFDFIKDDNADNFAKALPYVDKYLSCINFADAINLFEDIKKYYPKPNENQQEQMDEQMGQTQGLSLEEMEELAKRLLKASAKKSDVSELDAQEEFFGTAGDLSHEDYKIKRELNKYKALKGEHANTINALAALLRSIIKDNAVKRFARPFKRGKLDAKRMYKYLATDNLRIFKKPRVISKKDYTMAILVDQSGSMDGQLSGHSLRGAIVLIEVFEQLGLPYEVLGFRDEVFVYKTFNGALKPAIIPSMAKSRGGTNDIHAINVLEKHIKQFDSNTKYRKGVFIITDGEGNDPKTMKKLVTKIEDEQKTTVFGIGIGGVSLYSLKQTYNNYLQVNNVQDLPKTLVGLMRTQFKRG